MHSGIILHQYGVVQFSSVSEPIDSISHSKQQNYVDEIKSMWKHNEKKYWFHFNRSAILIWLAESMGIMS